MRMFVDFISFCMLFLLGNPSSCYRAVFLVMSALVCLRAFKINNVSGRAVRYGLRMSTSSSGAGSPATVNNMNVVEFHKILTGSNRHQYQIIDVREKDELLSVALSGSDVLNLPLSEANTWTQKVLMGELLDKRKPLLCLCKMGGRSMKAATFFGTHPTTALCILLPMYSNEIM